MQLQLNSIEPNTLLIDIATRNVVSLGPDDVIGKAVRIMAEKRISSILITDADGHPAGIVTESNVLCAMLAKVPSDTPLHKVMSTPVITVPDTMTCLDAYQVSLRDGIRHLVIVDDEKRLLGVVSETDFRLHINLAVLAGYRSVALAMTRSVFSLKKEDRLLDALNLMQLHRDTCVVVVEAERPIGILTERDIVRLYSKDPSRTDISIGSVMATPVLTISLDHTTNEAANLMLKAKVRHLVVVDQKGRMAGLVSEHDLTQTMVQGLVDERSVVDGLFLRTLIDTIPDLVWLKNVEGVYLACNARFENFFGAKESKIVGKTDYDFLDKELADFFRGHDRKAMEAGKPCINEEWLTFATDGYRGLFETVKTPMYGRNGELIGVLGIAHDVTSRWRLEESLKENELKFHDIFESVTDSIELVSMDGLIVDINQAGYERQGYTKEEMVGRPLAAFRVSEHATKVSERIAEIRKSGHATFESVMLHRNGTSIPIEVNTRLVELGGQPLFLGISRDISERVAAERMMRHLNADLGATLRAIPDLLFELGSDGRYLDIWAHNPELLAAQKELLLGRTVREMLPSAAADTVMLALKRAEEKGYSYGEIIQIKLPQGDSWFELSTAVKASNESSDKRFIMLSRDITDRMNAEETLRKLSAAVEQSAASVVITDMEPRIQYVNSHFIKNTGYSAAEVIGQNPRLLQSGKTPKETYLDLWNKLASGQEWNGELFNKRKNGELYWEDVSISPIKNSEGVVTHYVGVKTEITARKRIEDALYFIAQRSWQENAKSYFDALVQYLGKELNVDYVIVDRLDTDSNTAETIALYAKGTIVPNMRYSLKGTPCENVMGRDFCCYRQGVQQSFPDDALLAEMGVESYAGIPLWDSTGQALGLIAVMDSKPLPDDGALTQLLRIVSTRAAAELERKLSEDRLREQKEFLASIFENALDAVMLMDSKGVITGWSKQAEQIFGWNHEEAVGRLMHETIIPVQYREKHVRGMQHFLATGEGPALNTRIEISALHRDGHEFPVELSISPIKTQQGYEFSSFIRDISRRKQLERKLAESEEMFRAIFEQAANGVELIDPVNLRIIEANPAACRMLGYTQDEYLKLRLEDTQADLHGEALRAAVQQIENTGGAIFQNRHRCKNGDVIDVEVTARVLKIPGKRLLVGVWRDVTESKRAETKLRESETKYRELFETAGDGIFIQGASGFIDCNEKGASMYGLTRAELIGRHPSELAPERQPDGRLSAEVAGAIVVEVMSGNPRQFEWQALCADGSLLDVEINLSRIELKGEVCLQAVVRDISLRKMAESALRESEEKLRSLYELSPLGIALTDMAGHYIEFNDSFRRICGYTRDELNALDYWALTPKRYAAAEARQLESLATTGRYGPHEKEYIQKDGTLIPLRLNGISVTGRDGQKYIWSIVEDITESKRAEANLRITASVFDNTQEAIVLTDASNIIIDVNPAFSVITGYGRDEVLGKNPKLLSSGRQSSDFYAQLWETLKEHKAWRGEIWNRRKDGEIYAEMLSISAICDDEGNVQRHVGVFSDITYFKNHEAELSRIANYDALTGIPNRRLLADRLRQAIAHAQRNRKLLAICYLDLDGFKAVNDEHGHEAGDKLLVDVSRRLQEILRAGDTLARLGGDEFVMLFNDLAREQECYQVLDRVLNIVALPIDISDHQVMVSASIGVSFYPSENVDGDTLLRHADQAMYIAKQAGKNRYHLYDSAHDQRVRALHESRRKIVEGLENNEFELFYQPKIELLSGNVIGVEALIRWHHPENGILLPAEFLPYIEDSDLEIRLGEWVMDTAMAQFDKWCEEGLTLEVSINISARHLQSPDFVSRLEQKLAQHPNLLRDKLQIEVLETAALEDIAQSSETIEACRKLGVNFALDDFGTGYSSLAYLRKLSAETLKIDQTFVRGMLTDEGDRAIVQGIIALAKTFGRKTVAEGMEAAELTQMLIEIGCMYGQGYGIAHPMPAQDFLRWHKERK